MGKKSLINVMVVLFVLAIAFSTVFVSVAGANSETEKEVPLIISAHTATGNQGFPEDQVCVLRNRFKPGQMILWRAKVYDPETGNTMDDDQLQFVKVKLSDGKTFTARYGGHPPDDPKDYFWTATWHIPAVYPTGSLPYTIEAKAKDGRTGEFSEFEVKPSLLTIVPREEG